VSLTPRLVLPGALSAGLGVLALLAGSSGPAAAVDAAKPTPCTGVLLTDPAGDQELAPLLPIGETTSPPNMDITSLFLNFRADKDGKKVLTANIEVANLDKTVPAQTDSQGGVYYYVIYSHSDAVRFVAAHNTGSAINYEYGVIDPDLGTYTTEGTTAGTFFEGAKGVVQIDVPEAVGGKVGETLKGTLVTIDGIDIGTDHANGINNHADTAPDEANVLEPDGKDYTVAECAGGSTGGGGGATPTPTPGPGGPTPTPTPAPGGGGGATTPSTLPVKFANGIGRAKKARKGKKLAFAAKASQPISNLKLKLRKLGGKGPNLATGKAASLKAGNNRVSIKLKKNLKKGVYTLLATGVVNGKTLSVGQKVGVK
jgi:hypothetical protein